MLPGVPARRAFRTPQFVALFLGVVLFGMVQALQQHFAPLFVEHGVELAVAGTLISVMALTGVVSNMAVGTLNDRRGTVTAAVFALACQLVSMAAYVVGTGFVPLALATVLFGFGAVLQPRPCAAGSRPSSVRGRHLRWRHERRDVGPCRERKGRHHLGAAAG